MNNSYIIKKIRNIFIRQLLSPVLLFIIFGTVLFRAPGGNILHPRPLNYRSQFENFYNSLLPHVELTVPTLYYSGMDYVVEGHTEGYYYYTLVDGYCQFYVLDKDTADTPERALQSADLRGRLIRLDDVEYRTILRGMEKHLNWTAASLQTMVSPYAVSTVSSPAALNLAFYLVLYIGLAVFISDILCRAVYIWEPLFSPAFRYLGPLRHRRTQYSIHEMEIRHTLLARTDHLYLTAGYVILLESPDCILLPLDMISQAYCHSRKKLFSHKNNRFSYILTIVTQDRHSYNITRKSREELELFLNQLQKKLQPASPRKINLSIF